MLELLRRIPHSVFKIVKPAVSRTDTSQQQQQSCSRTTKTNVGGRTALLERLPDELIIYTLSMPGIEVTALHAISEFSYRLKCLAVPIMLSKFQLTTVVDQEGRGKTTTHYSFCKYDMDAGTATFVAVDTRSRRYKHTQYAAVPILRSLAYQILVESSNDDERAIPTLHLEASAREDHIDNNNNNNQFVCHSSDIPAHDNNKRPSIIITKKTKSLRVGKTGSHLVTSDERLLPNNQPLWQLGYLVSAFSTPTMTPAARITTKNASSSSSSMSAKSKSDVYFTAVFITVQVSTLFESACPTSSTTQAGRKRKRSSVHRMSASLQWLKRQNKQTEDHQLFNAL